MTQARVDELENMGPDEVGHSQEYLGGHGLRVQINKGPNTWFQQVTPSPDERPTTMGLGRTRRISFANAKKWDESCRCGPTNTQYNSALRPRELSADSRQRVYLEGE